MISVTFPFGLIPLLAILMLVYIYLRQRSRLEGQRNIFFLAVIFFFALLLLVPILHWFTPWF